MKKSVQIVGALTAVVLLVGSLSMAFALTCQDRQAVKASCSYAGCDLSIYTMCGWGTDDASCGRYYIQTNLIDYFACAPYPNSGTNCVPAQDPGGGSATTNCMRYTKCIYSQIQGMCIAGPASTYCPAPYMVTTNC